MSRRLFGAALLATVLVLSVLVAPSLANAPSKRKWLKDTRSAMYGSRAYLDRRVERGGVRPAVNLDIDNTALATRYRPGRPVPVVLRFARYAQKLGVSVVFNTARDEADLPEAVAQLRRAGYPVSAICGRRASEAIVESKQRCRQQYVDAGFTIIANVGNRSTDFVGGNYQRGFRLPSYGRALS